MNTHMRFATEVWYFSRG